MGDIATPRPLLIALPMAKPGFVIAAVKVGIAKTLDVVALAAAAAGSTAAASPAVIAPAAAAASTAAGVMTPVSANATAAPSAPTEVTNCAK